MPCPPYVLTWPDRKNLVDLGVRFAGQVTCGMSGSILTVHCSTSMHGFIPVAKHFSTGPTRSLSTSAGPERSPHQPGSACACAGGTLTASSCWASRASRARCCWTTRTSRPGSTYPSPPATTTGCCCSCGSPRPAQRPHMLRPGRRLSSSSRSVASCGVSVDVLRMNAPGSAPARILIRTVGVICGLESPVLPLESERCGQCPIRSSC